MILEKAVKTSNGTQKIYSIPRFQSLEWLESELKDVSSLAEGLSLLRDYLAPLGVFDLVYGFMVRPLSFVRHDVIFTATLPSKLMEEYYKSGGPNADPVAENTALMSKPMFIDLAMLYNGKTNGKYYRHKFVKAMIEAGYESLWACPITDKHSIGFGSMTYYQHMQGNKLKIRSTEMKKIGSLFHKTMKKNGQLAGYFDLTHLEKTTLSKMAEGKTVRDIAWKAKRTSRTIELRLGAARKKLRARTTTEAVYKAAAYGIFPTSG
jgi:DNA-binding CsgD family transcriptional regulator